ncbi:hypothetical protein D3C80_1003270 [compost metagenome]
MDHRHPVVVQQPGDPVEVLLIIGRADVLEHADRDDAVEGLVQVAIVLQPELGPVRQAARRRAFVGRAVLFGRQGDAGDSRSALGHRQAQAAPAAADVQRALSRRQQQLVDQPPLLGDLGLIQGRVRRLEEGAGILQVLVQKQPIEVDRQVIVVVDVAAGVQPVVGLLRAAPEALQQGQLSGARPDRQLRRGQLQEVVDVAVLDPERPVHIGLAQRQVGIGGDGQGRLRIRDHHRQFRRARPRRQLAPVRQTHPNGPRQEGLVEKGLQHPALRALNDDQAWLGTDCRCATVSKPDRSVR